MKDQDKPDNNRKKIKFKAKLVFFLPKRKINKKYQRIAESKMMLPGKQAGDGEKGENLGETQKIIVITVIIFIKVIKNQDEKAGEDEKGGGFGSLRGNSQTEEKC